MKNLLSLLAMVSTISALAVGAAAQPHAAGPQKPGFHDQPQANLVVNGNFSLDLSAWSPGEGLAQWTAESVLADGTGSARLTNNHPDASTESTVLFQCVPVSPGPHLLTLAVRVPSGQTNTGGGRAVAYAYGNNFCGNAPVAGGFFTPINRASSWSIRSIPVNVPAGAASVSVRLDAFKDQAGGTLAVLVDSVELDEGGFFRDGFE